MRPSRLVVITVLALTTVLAPVSADADAYFHRDARGDLQAMDDNSETWTPRPEYAEGDIIWTRVTHLPRTVRVRIKLAALGRVDGGGEAAIRFRTGWTGPTREWIFPVNASWGDWAGDSGFWFYDDCDCMRPLRPAAEECPGRSHTMDYADDSILMIVPRSCLRNPRFVRVAIDVSRGWDYAPSSTGPDDAPGVYDDAYRSGTFPTGATDGRYGPRVLRG